MQARKILAVLQKEERRFFANFHSTADVSADRLLSAISNFSVGTLKGARHVGSGGVADAPGFVLCCATESPSWRTKWHKTPARAERPGRVSTQVLERGLANGGTAGRRLGITAPYPSSCPVAGRSMCVYLSFGLSFIQFPPLHANSSLPVSVRYRRFLPGLNHAL